MFSLTAIAAGLVVSLCVAEIVLHRWLPRPDSDAMVLAGSPRQYGYPGHFSGYAGGVRFVTNAVGFRGREFSEAHSGGDIVLVVLGDSYAFGYGVDYASSFPAVVEQALSSSGTHVKVFVLALPGYNTAQELATLHEWAPRLMPDVILLSYHLNDIERQATMGDGRPDKSGRGWTLREHSAVLRLLFPQLAAIGRALRLPVTTTATAELNEYVDNGDRWRRNQETLQNLIAFTDTIHARLGAIVVPYIVALNDDHPAKQAYNIVANFFNMHAVPVKNAFPYFKGLKARPLWINMFDGHPNAVGHSYIAKAALDLIRDNRLIDRPLVDAQ